jgi:hypothetical protein
MRELLVKRGVLTSGVPADTAFEYTSDGRIQDRATLESDSSGIRWPG